MVTRVTITFYEPSRRRLPINSYCSANVLMSNRAAKSLVQSAPISSIRVGTFQCSNEITTRAVRNVFAEVLLKHADVKVVQDGEADVVIEGTVTTSTGSSGSGGV